MDEKDLEELRDLVELLKSNGVAHFQMERADWRVKLSFTGPNEKTGSPAQSVDLAQLAQMVNGGAAAPTAPQTAPAPVAALAVAAEAQNDTAEAEANLHVVKSPLVGTFYPSPSPGADPFVKVGDRVAMGQVLCIVEAMKLMNEVEADASGEVVKVLVEPGQPVEYGQGLFAVRS